jgi:NAD(P)-dependent dehydrogenase (short-subunit alcohol dehydrogenase family)
VHHVRREYFIRTNGDNGSFKGKVALVTGGSGEIGRAICLRLAAEGATVYVGGRNLDNATSVAREAVHLNGVAIPIVIDVTKEESIERAFRTIVDEHGKVDVLVNCAGGSTRDAKAPLSEQLVELIDNMIKTNLRGSLLCSREAAKYMKQHRSGKIVNIGSVIALRGKACFTDYAASKGGIIAYTSSLAIELGPFGITVNCVSPGFIQRATYTERELPYLINSNVLGRVGSPEDVANAVVFLASSQADFITGQNLCVDGGRSLGLRGD